MWAYAWRSRHGQSSRCGSWEGIAPHHQQSPSGPCGQPSRRREPSTRSACICRTNAAYRSSTGTGTRWILWASGFTRRALLVEPPELDHLDPGAVYGVRDPEVPDVRDALVQRVSAPVAESRAERL